MDFTVELEDMVAMIVSIICLTIITLAVLVMVTRVERMLLRISSLAFHRSSTPLYKS